MMSYTTGSRMAVLVVLSKTKAWMDTKTIMAMGNKLSGVPTTPNRDRGGGWSVFSWPDRTMRYVRYWVRMQHVEELKKGRYTYFRATVEGRRAATLFSLQFKEKR